MLGLTCSHCCQIMRKCAGDWTHKWFQHWHVCRNMLWCHVHSRAPNKPKVSRAVWAPSMKNSRAHIFFSGPKLSFLIYILYVGDWNQPYPLGPLSKNFEDPHKFCRAVGPRACLILTPDPFWKWDQFLWNQVLQMHKITSDGEFLNLQVN